MSKKSLHSMDTVFVLILFALFVAMTLLISCAGALAYKNAAAQMEDRFNRQTCISYITAKVRANNEQGKISIGELEGIPALCITDNFGDAEYITYIYQYEGTVRELFCNAEIALSPDAGSVLAEADGLEFSRKGSLLEIKLSDSDNGTVTFYINTV